MSTEMIRMIGTIKMIERGSKYYHATVGVGFPIYRNRRVLLRRWKTDSEAIKYMVDFFATWARLHK